MTAYEFAFEIYSIMKYLNFFTDERALDWIKGSPIEDIDRVEKELGIRIPEALREYLRLMGVKPMGLVYNEHGTNDIKLLHEWIYEEFEEYRAQGYEFNEIKTILPFERAMDNFFFVPVEEGVEDPPVMTLIIDARPTVEKYSESVTAFVKLQYEGLLQRLYQQKK